MFKIEYETKLGEQIVVEYREFARPGYVTSSFQRSGFHVSTPEEAVKIYEKSDGRKHLRGELWMGDILGHRQTHHADQLEIISHLDDLCGQRLDSEDLGAEVEVFLYQRDFIRQYN
jgi:hypothetical protein